MTKDKALEELFLAQKPVFDDQEIFMQKLERKLEAVEYIKQYEEAQLRRYHYAIIATFVIGLLSGGALLTFILNTPIDKPLFTFKVASGFLLEIQQNSRIIVSTGLMLFLSYGAAIIVNNILDIIKMTRPFHPPMADKTAM